MRTLALLGSAIVFSGAARGQIAGASELLDNRDGRNDHYGAIGRYRGGPTCTAFWIDTGTGADAPAYALASGHCVDTSPTKVHLGRTDTGTVTFRFFRDTAARHLAVRTRGVAYATMKGLDLAVLELDSTRGALLEAGLRPIEIAAAPPGEGEAIEIVGAPVTDIPTEESFLRRAVCAQGPAADLIEWIWHFRGAWRNECSDIKGGSSGSPVMIRATGKVFAALNTSTAGARYDSGGFPCYNGQPCEIGRDGWRYLRDVNYAIPITGIERCFDERGRFDAARPACPLDPGRQLDLTTPRYVTRGPRAPWNVTLSGPYSYYRYKTFAEGRDDCRSAGGYGAPIRLADRPRIEDPIPDVPGRHYLCVLAGDTPQPDSTWQEPRFASLAHVRVDVSPPSIPIPYVYRDEGESYTFDPIFVLPEFSDYSYKIGLGAGASCQDRAGYQPYRRFMVRVAKTADLERFCLIGRNDAGNETVPLDFPLRGTQIFPEGVRSAASLRAVDAGPLAPGSIVTVYGANLGGAALRLTDSAGVRHDVAVLYASAAQLNARIPPGAALGPAQLEAAGSEGAARAAVTLAAVSPGVFTKSWSGGGAPAGYAVRGASRQALDGPIDPPAEGEELRLVVYATGIGAGRVRVTLGGVELEDAVAAPVEGQPGLETVAARVPASFRLAGYLTLEVRSGETKSNPTTVRIRAR